MLSSVLIVTMLILAKYDKWSTEEHFFNSLSPDGEGNESFHATYEIDTISLL